MDIQEAIEWFSFRKKMCLSDKCQDAEDCALTALQEQAEREKGCEFCGQNGDRIIEAFGDGWMKIVNAADHFAAETEDNDATTTLFFNIEFCPICGKRLK